MAYLVILSKDYMLWMRLPKLSLASESFTMSHHYLLSYTGLWSVSVLFLRSYCTLLRHPIVLLQHTRLSLSVLTCSNRRALRSIDQLLLEQPTHKRLAWGLSQCACLTSGIPFYLRLNAAHFFLFLKLSLRHLIGLLDFLNFSIFSFYIVVFVVFSV